MTTTPAKKAPSKRAALPRPPVDDGSVFVIPADPRRYRYLLTGGKILDVESPYRCDSNDRGAVLIEAQRRWGGKKDDWKIEGVSRLED